MGVINQSANIFALLAPAFISGLKDGINPCSMATVLIFIILSSILGRTSRQIFWIGALFILTSINIQFALLMGYLDHFLTDLFVLKSIRIIYLILAILFILISVIDLFDWWQFKKTGNDAKFRFRLPVFFHDKSETVPGDGKLKVLRIFGIVILTMLLANFSSLMRATYPQDEYIFIVHSYLVSGADKGFVYQSFLTYCIAIVSLLIVAWVKIWWLALEKSRSLQAGIYYKMVLSALFMSTGIGLGYLFI